MSFLRIEGGQKLTGRVVIAGAKNATLPILASGLLSGGCLRLENVPRLEDTAAMTGALRALGVSIEEVASGAESDTGGDIVGGTVGGTVADVWEMRMEQPPRPLQEGEESLARDIRTGVLFLGPMLSRFGWAQACLPGGCRIGARPLDLHIWGLEKLGASIQIGEKLIEARGRLRGCDLRLPSPSVGASENLLMAAACARGTTRLRGVAREPEVVDLCRCLRAMGARLQGEGSDEIIVEGSDGEPLGDATHRLLPDRIETGSYALAVAAVGGSLLLCDTPPREDLAVFFEHLQRCGVSIVEEQQKEEQQRCLRITREGALAAVSLTTGPHPGFPTDLQAQFTAAMCFADKTNDPVVVTETVFENRFMHLQELQRMGAVVKLEGGGRALLSPQGAGGLVGANVVASDLRASFSLVIAGLAARGTTTIASLHHLDRGYERLEEKLSSCGARIERVADSAPAPSPTPSLAPSDRRAQPSASKARSTTALSSATF